MSLKKAKKRKIDHKSNETVEMGHVNELKKLTNQNDKCDGQVTEKNVIFDNETLAVTLLPRSEPEIENGDYNPYDHRNVNNPTSNIETLIHLLKGSLGTGILAMPLAFYNAGTLFGFIMTFIIGFICTYCIHMLVTCSRVLCVRNEVPSLEFSAIIYEAFLNGPLHVRKYANAAKMVTDIFVVLEVLGVCCVFIVSVATNIQQVFALFGFHHDIKWFIAGLTPPLIALNSVRTLKLLTPFSCIADILTVLAIIITFYFMFNDLKAIDERPMIADYKQLPLFFGTAIFALEGIGVIMPLENNMKTPGDFIGCPSVLSVGMVLIVSLYSLFGLFGYLRWEKPEGSITLNLPQENILGVLVRIMFAASIFLTYSIHFYVLMEMVLKELNKRLQSCKHCVEYSIRASIIILTATTAALVPNLGPFISLTGSLCLSVLGIIMPAIIELVTYADKPGYGRFRWILVKDLAIILFGIFGLITGTYTSIREIVETFRKTNEIAMTRE